MEKYKFTIIYSGNEPINKKDGEIEYLGLKKDYEYHAHAIYDYVVGNYGKTGPFKNITQSVHVESASYVLTVYGSVIFINSTPTNEKEFEQYGYSGLFMLPQVLTDNQREELLKYIAELEDYSLEILYEINTKEGIIGGKSLRKQRGYSSEALINLISNYGKSKKR